MIRKINKLKAKKGFTLVELIVVIAIIGVLAAILVPTMLGFVQNSQITSADTSASTISNAVKNWLTELDSNNHGMRQNVGNTGTITITFPVTAATNIVIGGTPTWNNGGPAALAANHFLSADIYIGGVLEEVAVGTAIVYLNGGRVVGAAYCADTTATPNPWPVDTDFTAGTFAWGGNKPGIQDNSGLIIGTSPKLALGAAASSTP